MPPRPLHTRPYRRAKAREPAPPRQAVVPVAGDPACVRQSFQGLRARGRISRSGAEPCRRIRDRRKCDADLACVNSAKGAEFHAELALASRSRHKCRGMTRDVHPRILIVEDEKDIVQVLEFALRQAGFETVFARDAGEAFARIREKAPDAVILDLMLPDISGTEICRQLKGNTRTATVPVIMLTARSEEVDRVVGFELGADDYITKPFSVREVVLRVKAILRRGVA